MGRFEIITKKDQDLTFIVLSGKILSADVIEALKVFYDSEVTSKILWDFSDCDVASLLSVDLPAFIDAAKNYAHLRVNGKSALVGPSDFAFGLGRMQATIAELERYPIRVHIFRSVDEAMVWLNS